MRAINVLVFVGLFLITSGNEINYCGAKMCGYTNAHTFCQFAIGTSPYCSGYIPAALTPGEKSRILARLNRRRDDVASGKLKNFPSAGNMLKLRWVAELAREAQLWADQCRPPQNPEEKDACRDLYSVSVGQCVASVVGESPGLRVESMVDIWFMQNLKYKGNITLYEPPASDSHNYGDFAQMIWARTYMVGCGRSRFMITMRGRLKSIDRLVCNFAPHGPPANRPLWLPGVPGSACPSRARPYAVLTSLCDYQYELNQPNDIDDSMTLEEHIILNAMLDMEKQEIQATETHVEGSLDSIFLTYLKIVTMNDTAATTVRAISMQKRDIKGDSLNITTTTSITTTAANVTIASQNDTNTTIAAVTQKVQLTKTKEPKNNALRYKLDGRPKNYNMDELSEVVSARTEEYHETPDALSKRRKEFYEEYNMDLRDGNEIVTDQNNISKESGGSLTSQRDDIVIVTDQLNITKESVDFLTSHTMHDKGSNTSVSTVKATYFNAVNFKFEDHILQTESVTYFPIPDQSSTAREEIVDEEIKKTLLKYIIPVVPNNPNSIDDYLTDPETVQQLQEALDRIENGNMTKRSVSKMRRDLRDVPSEDIETNALQPDEHIDVSSAELAAGLSSISVSLLPESELTSTLTPEEERNLTLERAPMIDMVMNYMPYLRKYESELLRSNSAMSVISTFDYSIYLTLLVLCF